MKTLIFITKTYPYDIGETFIENEITVLSNSFERVIILPIEVDSKSKMTRNVPKNVIVLKPKSRNNKVNFTLLKLLSLFSIFKNNSNVDHLANNYRKRIFLSYFVKKTDYIFSMIDINNLIQLIDKDSDVYIYSYWMFTTSQIALKLKNILMDKLKISRIFTRAHRYDLYEEENKLNYLPYREKFLRQFDLVFPCSLDGEIYLKKKYPNFESKITKKYLGTLDWGIGPQSDNGIVFVSCSRIEEVKRVNLIVDVLSHLSIKFHWYHIGSGTLYRQVKSYAEKKLPNNSFTFLGNLDNLQVLDFYKQNHISLFINLSSSEGLPVSIMEVISFGIPVIATNVGGTKEIVINNFNGYLVDKNVDISKTALLIELYLNSNNIEKFRRNARSLWEINFNAYDNYSNLLKDVVEGEMVNV